MAIGESLPEHLKALKKTIKIKTDDTETIVYDYSSIKNQTVQYLVKNML
jgi:hypothetical protein